MVQKWEGAKIGVTMEGCKKMRQKCNDAKNNVKMEGCKK